MFSVKTGPKYSEISATLPPVDKSRIFFYRKAAFYGSPIQSDVFINGEKAGVSIPGAFFFVDLEPGIYEILIRTEFKDKIVLSLEKGKTYHVRMSVEPGVITYRVFPELVEKIVGESEIWDLRYKKEKVES